MRKRLKPQIAHLEALLELQPYPILLLDRRNERILLSNTKAVELTAFTRSEINGSHLSSLLPTLGELLFHPHPEAFVTTLLHRTGPGIQVFATSTLLDPQEQLTLISLEKAEQVEERLAERQRQAKRVEAFSLLARSFHQADLPSAYAMALEAGSLLTGSGIVAIYQAAGPEFQLQCQASFGPAELLPSQIHAHEMVVLQNPIFWNPKKRALSGLHRAARSAKLASLASAPLGQPNALIGILVAASEHPGAPQEILPLMETLAASITAIYQTHTLSTNLNDQLDALNREVCLGSTIKESMHEGVVILSADLAIVNMNPSAESILGYASREVEGWPYQNVLIGADHIIPPFVSDNADTQGYTLKNVRLYRRDGRSFLANVRTVPVVSKNDLDYLSVLIQDLSQEEQYRLRNQQLEQRALIGEVSAIFAHEVRNPINNISTGLQLMAMTLPEADPNQDVLNRLQHDCERLEELMKSTLAFVRPMEYKMEPLALQDTLPRLLERWRPHMARVNIQHHAQIDPNTSMILGDRRALEQVWNNLISNAIQAMGREGGSLIVKVRQVTTPENLPRVEVSISDTGTGIPEEARERIFEPFFTTNRSGTGLGLPIAKHIITAHRGSIKVNSVPGGTSFQVLLPTDKG